MKKIFLTFLIVCMLVLNGCVYEPSDYNSYLSNKGEICIEQVDEKEPKITRITLNNVTLSDISLECPNDVTVEDLTDFISRVQERSKLFFDPYLDTNVIVSYTIYKTVPSKQNNVEYVSKNKIKSKTSTYIISGLGISNYDNTTKIKLNLFEKEFNKKLKEFEYGKDVLDFIKKTKKIKNRY